MGRILAPDISSRSVGEREPKGLRLAEMLGNGPLSWEEPRRAFDLCQAA